MSFREYCFRSSGIVGISVRRFLYTLASVGILAMLGSCNYDGLDGGFGVAMTLRFADAIDDATVATVDAIEFTVSGGETYDHTVTLSSPGMRTERVVYRPASETRALTIEVRAFSTGGLILVASGTTGLLAISAGEVLAANVTLEPESPEVDAGADGADSGPVGCPGVYCLTFENDEGDDSSILQIPQGCQIVEDSTAHGGAHYGHCVATNATQMSLPIALSANQAVIGFRAWLRVMGSTEIQYANFAGVTDDDSRWMLVGSDGASHLSLNYTNETEAPSLSSSASADTAGAWRCVEMVATPPSGVVFYIDGQQVAQAGDLVLPSSFVQLALGIVRASNNAAMIDVAFDDIAVGYERIGCN